MPETSLDRARRALAAAPGDRAARLALFGAFSEAEIVVLLAAEPDGDDVRPELAAIDGTPHVLAYSDEERLADDLRRPAPCAALPGRALAALLAGQGIGVALDRGADTLVLTAADVDWLAGLLSETPEPASGRPVEVAAPESGAAATEALGRRLARAGGLAEAAWLVTATWGDGGRGPLLVLVDAAPGAEQPLAAAAGEAMAFAGGDEADLAVAIVAATDPMLDEVKRIGRQIPMPRPAPSAERAAPGSDPDRPPRLR